jgi:hypothetical protein
MRGASKVIFGGASVSPERTTMVSAMTGMISTVRAVCPILGVPVGLAGHFGHEIAGNLARSSGTT